MITKKTFLKVIPAVALACGALAFNFLGNGNGLVETKAADYTTSNRTITINQDKSVNVTFTVDGNTSDQIDIKGWLLCLFTTQPEYDPITRKITGSAASYPFVNSNCAHYYYVANEADTGNINVTWAADAEDQKTDWSVNGQTEEPAGTTLADALQDANDYYMVIGPRHWHDNTWAPKGDKHGQGNDCDDGGIWENCDYYMGRKNNIIHNFPSGEIYIDMTKNSDWQKDNPDFEVYFWDSNSHNGRSRNVSETPEYEGIYVASYELNFNPTGMLVYRYNPSDHSVWNQTNDVAFHKYGVIGIGTGDGKTTTGSWSSPLAVVDKTSGTDIVLDHYKRNASNESESYNDTVSLTEGDQFEIEYFGYRYTSFSTHSSLQSYFKCDETTNNKIQVSKTDTYSFYFNMTEGKRSVYITTPTIAAADKWSQSFLSGGCDATKSNWSNSKALFNQLGDSAQSLLRGAAYFDPATDLSKDSYFNQAMQRYDHVINKYGTSSYENFIGRTYSGESGANASGLKVTNTNTDAIVIIVGASATAILAGALFLLKKKKYE